MPFVGVSLVRSSSADDDWDYSMNVEAREVTSARHRRLPVSVQIRSIEVKQHMQRLLRD